MANPTGALGALPSSGTVTVAGGLVPAVFVAVTLKVQVPSIPRAPVVYEGTSTVTELRGTPAGSTGTIV